VAPASSISITASRLENVAGVARSGLRMERIPTSASTRSAETQLGAEAEIFAKADFRGSMSARWRVGPGAGSERGLDEDPGCRQEDRPLCAQRATRCGSTNAPEKKKFWGPDTLVVLRQDRFSGRPAAA